MSAQDKGLGAKKIKGLTVDVNRVERFDYRGNGAAGGGNASRDMHSGEGSIGDFPHLCARPVRGEDRSADVVGPHIIDHPAFDQRDGVPAVPDVFPQQRPRGLVVFGDPAALAVKHRVDRDRAW